MMARISMPRLAVLAAALALMFAGAPGGAQAAAIVVTTTQDELNSDGDCSLREAITAANADTITLPAGTYTLAIPGADEDGNATGDLDITSDLNVSGAGADTTVVDGNALDRAFE